MIVTVFVPLTYLAEVEIDEEKTIDNSAISKANQIKYKAIAKATKQFYNEFKNETILDVAHSLAPDMLNKVVIK